MKPIRIATLAVAAATTLTVSIAPVFAGGFGVKIDRATAQNSGKVKDAALIVHAYGCINPGTSNVTVTLEGLVNGERKTISLKPTIVSPDVYAISQRDLRKAQSPGDAWVVAINAWGRGMTQNSIVVLDAGGNVRAMRPAEKNRPEQLEFLVSREPFTSKQIMLALSKQANNPRTASATR